MGFTGFYFTDHQTSQTTPDRFEFFISAHFEPILVNISQTFSTLKSIFRYSFSQFKDIFIVFDFLIVYTPVLGIQLFYLICNIFSIGAQAL